MNKTQDTALNVQIAAPGIARNGLLWIIAYLLITLALYAYGPVAFTRHAVGQTVALVFGYMSMFAMGYLSISQKPGAILAVKLRPNTSLSVVKGTILLGLLVSLAKLTIYTSLETLSVNRLLGALSTSLQEPGTAYFDSFDQAAVSGPLIWALVLLSPISWSAFALSVAYFDRLGTSFRIVILLLFFAEAARWILNGQNKGAFDLVIIISAVLWIKMGQRRLLGARSVRSAHSGRLRLTLLISACSLGALILFTRAISSRTNNLAAIRLTDAGPLMDLTPAWLQPTLISVTSYLGQGYNALSYVSQLQWEPTFGVGHSLFLSLRLDQLFGTDIVDRMYQSRMSAYGIDPWVNWHSLYVWIANDVHWLGVIPIMFLLGRFSARVVLRALINDSASNYALLALTAIMLVYIPANAQIFQEPTTFVAFWGLLLYQIVFKSSRAPTELPSLTGAAALGPIMHIGGSGGSKSKGA